MEKTHNILNICHQFCCKQKLLICPYEYTMMWPHVLYNVYIVVGPKIERPRVRMMSEVLLESHARRLCQRV